MAAHHNLSQSKIGQILAPVVHALDVVAETSGYANVVEMSGAISGNASLTMSSSSSSALTSSAVEALQRRRSSKRGRVVRSVKL